MNVIPVLDLGGGFVVEFYGELLGLGLVEEFLRFFVGDGGDFGGF
jgi:hypothetical protein